MAFKDWTESIMSRMKNGGLFGGAQDEGDMESNMSNGGYSGYHPNQTKRNLFGTQNIRVNKQETMHSGRSGMTNMFAPVDGSPYNAAPMMPYPAQEPQQPQQDPAAQYTQGLGGFQTMQQPAMQPPMWAQQTMQQPAQQPMWPQQTMQQPVQQPMWQPQTAQQPVQPPVQQPMWPPQPAQQPMQQPQPQQQTMKQQLTGRLRSLRGKEAQQPRQEDNISYMPGTFMGNDGKAYSHVERVAQLVSVSACFRIIEFMRNGESVIVNTESIASEADVQRCLDMLAGAAFTLGCSLTKITQVKRAYLIAPKTVLVMQDVAVSRWSDRDQMPQQNDTSDEAYQSRFRPERGVYAPDRPYEPEQAMTYPQTAPSYEAPAAAPYQATSRQQPVPAAAPYQATSRQQAAPAYTTPAASFYQGGARQHTMRSQPREAYQSDTRRGYYGTAAGDGFGGFGQ